MKGILFIFVLALGGIRVMAQQEHFVFIQESNKQPFYVRVGEESQSSSASGHMIIAPVKDSVYNFFLGFPRARFAEQRFSIPVKQDMGYELKRIDGLWQLYDMQTQRYIRPLNTNSRDTGGVRRDDDYSRLMSEVVDDSSILYTEVLDTSRAVDSAQSAAIGVKVDTAVVKAAKGKKPAAKPVAAAKVVMKDTVVAKNGSAVKDSVVADNKMKDSAVRGQVVETASGQQEYRDPRDIIRFSTENVKGGKLIIYHDRSGLVADTIRIIIPRL